jgi:hypothetical protein
VGSGGIPLRHASLFAVRLMAFEERK